ncbi:hypothetical protein [Streptomyces sp. MST-110588]|uniref:hypothetical protein n=1 Tax=Streptomyces sp. MST-110588 TaxID=2833628 RepID=UPI001F5C8AAA|nr:hypothetical protein [Streptomyces sp. MST-110588]UNO42810.1 hypothetical protein KGS77_28870 [Streptomyces sp. MST-110588]
MCSDPDGSADRARPHIECRRRYDPDVDTDPVVAGPARYVTLSGRCRQEAEDLWVGHGAGRRRTA